MNVDLILLLIFAVVLAGVMWFNKKKVKIERIAFPLIYILMYRTKIGLKLMDKLAKRHPKLVKIFAFLGIIFGYVSMIGILVLLTLKVWDFIFNGSPSPIAPLLPGIKTVPGIPILSFWHWIISIFILAGIHEFSHGLVARLYNVKLKSSGFAVLSVFLPIIPAAFVEPDEKQLNKKSKKEQLGVLAAGSFSNYLTAAVFLILFLFVAAPALSATIESNGVVIAGLNEGFPAEKSGLEVGEEVVSVNNFNIENLDDFLRSLKDVKSGDKVELVTNVSSYSITAVNSFGKRVWDDSGYLGVVPSSITSEYKSGFKIVGETLAWIALLFYWVFTINLAVGMFNMLPLGPVDGGRMFFLASLHFLKDEGRAKRLWTIVSLFCLGLIIIGLMPFIIKLITFILSPLSSLFFG